MGSRPRPGRNMLQPSPSRGGLGGDGVDARAVAPGDDTPAPYVRARFDMRAGPAIIFLVAAVLVAYANAFTASWQFDDFAAIHANPSARSFAGWWSSLPG